MFVSLALGVLGAIASLASGAEPTCIGTIQDPPASSAAGSRPAASSPAESMHQLAAEMLESLTLPGLQLAVAVDGKVVHVENAGFADVERRIPVETTSQFRIGSVSKLLTATAAVRLDQDGKLDLDAPIGRYLDALPADK